MNQKTPEPVKELDETPSPSPSDQAASDFSSEPPKVDVPDFDQDGRSPEEKATQEAETKGEASDKFIGKQGFFDTHFKGGFASANIGFTLVTKSAPLQTLQGAPDHEAAREASDAIYDILRETESMHWIIKPGSKWFQRLVAIGSFGGVVYLSASAEIAARRAEEGPREVASDPVAVDVPETSEDGEGGIYKAQEAA